MWGQRPEPVLIDALDAKLGARLVELLVKDNRRALARKRKRAEQQEEKRRRAQD